MQMEGRMAKSEQPIAKVRANVSIPKDDYAELERVAKRKMVSVAWIVRERYLSSESPLFQRSG